MPITVEVTMGEIGARRQPTEVGREGVPVVEEPRTSITRKACGRIGCGASRARDAHPVHVHHRSIAPWHRGIVRLR